MIAGRAVAEDNEAGMIAVGTTVGHVAGIAAGADIPVILNAGIMIRIRALSVTKSEGTIAAIATPPGEGGIGIVRISGPESFLIASRIFASQSGRDFFSSRQKIFYGHILAEDGAMIDEVLVHKMRAPHSFTREDVVEINTHGGMAPLNAVLERVLTEGARLARAGEFTLRAFLNGRIDLVQAEAVIDLIQARTKAGLQAANTAAQGVLSKAIHEMRDTLANALAQIEAAVDFPEEDTPDYITPELIAEIQCAQVKMQSLLASADTGRLLREGATVVLAGRTNVGKSSLFNALLRDTRAIVTEVAGTTRDRIEEFINIGGIPVKLVDTAGVRETEDQVEQIGVSITWETVRNAHLALWVLDASQKITEEDMEIGTKLMDLGLPVLVLWNKIDLSANETLPKTPLIPVEICSISAKTGEGMLALEAILAKQLMGGAHISADQALLTRTHQKESLRRAEEAVMRLLQNIENSPEFLAEDLREALEALGEITGECTPDDILEKIFASFCIGK